MRVSGAFDLEEYGLFGYWADGGLVSGHEVRLETREAGEAADDEDDEDEATSLPGPGQILIDDQVRRDIDGWAYDVGGTWRLPLAGAPRLTLGYARGSGDTDPDDAADHAFRQTGLQGNEPGYGGVERFHGYGELLDPELSNLAICTLGLGVSLLEASSLDVIYHRYRLVERVGELRDAQLDGDLTGTSEELGEAIDVILALEEWARVQFRLSGSLFHVGDAFREQRGKWIAGGQLDFSVAF